MTVWPAAVTDAGVAVLVTVSAGPAVAPTVAVEAFEVTAGPVGGVPVAVAVSTTEPASTSACVTVYVPVHVVDVCGASVVTGHVMTGGVPVPENAVSVTLTPVTPVLPVLVTTKEYVTVWPAAVTVPGAAVFSNDRLGAGVAVTVADEALDVTGGPAGGVPVAVAVFVTEPASTSACVTVYEPVQVVDACGASVVTGHVMTGGVPVPENAVSATLTPVSVVLPKLVIAYE